MLKILHTSDWHIGRALYGRKRYEEFEALLSWLADIIAEQQVDVLLVAGDVFDTSTPSNRAQGLYYRFLCQIAATSCRHVVVIGGNHDSPSFLNAPRELLKALNIHVVGASNGNYEEEVLLLKNQDENPELMVCAVPYLRDRDIRSVEAGESIEDKERKLLQGIREHYSRVCKLAEQRREALAVDIPIIAMGHLFTAGGQTIDGDGVRELYVGSIAHVTSEIFPASIDYLALGHLHVPQKINNSNVMRYSGSPLPMGFGESRQEKSVCLVELAVAKKDRREVVVTPFKVPVFQALEQIKGSWDEIYNRILELDALQSSAWLEIIYEGEEVISDLREQIDRAVSATEMEVIRVRNNRIIDQVLNRIHDNETLDDLDVYDVFARCLDAHKIPDEQRTLLQRSYAEIIRTMQEHDVNAE